MNNTGYKNDYFSIEKLNNTNGEFEQLSIQNSLNTNSPEHYVAYDTHPTEGDNFYRIRSISRDGKEAYSRIVKVTLGKTKAGFTVFPNPVSDGMIGLQMKNIPAGTYTVKVIGSDGKMFVNEAAE